MPSIQAYMRAVPLRNASTATNEALLADLFAPDKLVDAAARNNERALDDPPC